MSDTEPSWKPPESVVLAEARKNELTAAIAHIQQQLGERKRHGPSSDVEYDVWRHRATNAHRHYVTELRQTKRWLHEQRVKDGAQRRYLLAEAYELLKKCQENGVPFTPRSIRLIDELAKYARKEEKNADENL